MSQTSRRKAIRARAATHLLLLLHDATCYLDCEIINLSRMISAYFSLSAQGAQESSGDIILSLMPPPPGNPVPSNATLTLMALLALQGDKMTKTSLRWVLEEGFTLIYHFLDSPCLLNIPAVLQNQSNTHTQLESEMLSGLSTMFRATVRAGKQQTTVSLHCLLDVFAFNAWVSLVALTTCCVHRSINSLSAIRINNLLTETGKIMSASLAYLPSKVLIEMFRFVNEAANLPQPFDSVGLGFKSFLEHAIVSHAVSVGTNLPVLLTPGWIRCKRGCKKLLSILVQAHANADCLCDFVVAAESSLASQPNSSLQFNCLTVSIARALKLATCKVPCDLTRRALCKLRQLANLPSTVMNSTYVQCCDALCSSAFESFSTKRSIVNSILNVFNNTTETAIVSDSHRLWQTNRILMEKICWIIQSTLRFWDTRVRVDTLVGGTNFESALKLALGRIYEIAVFLWLERGPMHGLLRICQLNTIAIHTCRSPTISGRLHRSLIGALLVGATFDRTSWKFILETSCQRWVLFPKKLPRYYSNILLMWLLNTNSCRSQVLKIVLSSTNITSKAVGVLRCHALRSLLRCFFLNNY